MRLACTLAAAFVALAAPSLATADPVDDVIKGYMDASHIPGAAVAVIEGGRITKLQGYGLADIEWNGAVTADTPFQTASASKIFAGVVLMRLVERGALGLDDSIARFFPEAPDSWKQITVRQLASHTSGLPEGLGLPTTATVQEFATEAMKRPLAFEPGTESRYGMTDFVVMTAIMEKVGGASYPELVRREIVEPLGLTRTGFSMMVENGRVRSSIPMAGRSAVYAWRADGQREEIFLYPVHAYAAGGLYSSARDFATLMAALEAGRLLKPDSFALLTTPARLKNGREGAFGVGWTTQRYRGLAVVGHSGGPALADVLHVPERDLTVIVLTNQRLFYPMAAQSVADLKLPPAPAARPIADRRPALTTAVRTFLEKVAAGQVDESGFNEKGKGALGFYREWGAGMLRAAGPVRGVRLMAEVTTPAGELRRRYQVEFERRAIEFVVRTDAEGRWSELQPLAGDDR